MWSICFKISAVFGHFLEISGWYFPAPKNWAYNLLMAYPRYYTQHFSYFWPFLAKMAYFFRPLKIETPTPWSKLILGNCGWKVFQCSFEYIHSFLFLARLKFHWPGTWHLRLTGNRKSNSKSICDICHPWDPYSQNQSRHLGSLSCLYVLDFNLYAFLGPFF